MSAADGMHEPKITRRTFALRGMTIIGGAIAAAVAVPVVGFATAPGWRSKLPWRVLSTSIVPTLRSDGWSAAGKLADFEVGVPHFLQVERHVVDGWVTETAPVGVYVVRKGDLDAVVFDPHCTHLGCPLAWSSGAGEFVCPCHGGAFTPTGDVAAGPPPRPMIRYQTKVEDGQLLIGPLDADAEA